MADAFPPATPLTPERVGELSASIAGPIVSVAPLAGDASTRQFFRLGLAGGRRLVAMVFDGPIDPASHPQIVVGRYLESLGLPVPRLVGSAAEAGLLLYEDLGDTLLQDLVLGTGPVQGRLRGVSPAGEASSRSGVSPGGRASVRHSGDEPAQRQPDGECGPLPNRTGSAPEPTLADSATHQASALLEIERYYAEAVGLIALLQGPGTRDLPPGHPCALSALDRERFLFELEFFREHYVERLCELRLGPGERAGLGEFFEALATDAAAPPRVLCHRDYHSRNLMIWHGRLHVVDFQDARLGPVAYDLASLLRDSYTLLPAGLRIRMIELFLEKTGSGPTRSSFLERFDIVALQRNLKAIGTFAYQATVLGRDRYLGSIAPTWGYVFDELGRLPAYSAVRPLLERIAAS